MRWSLIPAAPTSSVDSAPRPLADEARRLLIMSRLQDLVAWGRKSSIWPFNFGPSCCYVEMAASLTSNTTSRLSAEVIRGKMAPIIKRAEQMMDPRWVT